MTLWVIQLPAAASTTQGAERITTSSAIVRTTADGSIRVISSGDRVDVWTKAASSGSWIRQ